MFLKKRKQKDGRVRISFCYGFRDPETGKTKHKTYKNLGYLDDYEHLYDDPEAHFKEVAANMTYEEVVMKNFELGTVDAMEEMKIGESSMAYLGYAPLSKIYHDLGIDDFLNNKQRSVDVGFSINDTLQTLLYSKILYPNSLYGNLEIQDTYSGLSSPDKLDAIDAVDYILDWKDELALRIHENYRFKYKRGEKFYYYSFNNIYSEMFTYSTTDDSMADLTYRLGLFLDEDNVPMYYRVFSPNLILSEADLLTSMGTVNRIKDEYKLDRLVQITDTLADKNTDQIHMSSANDGFMIEADVMKMSERDKEILLNQDSYKVNIDLMTKFFPGSKDVPYIGSKSKIEKNAFYVEDNDGNKKKVDIKKIYTYSKPRGEAIKSAREDAIEKAKFIIENKLYYKREEIKDSLKYIKGLEYDEDDQYIYSGTEPEIDEDLIAEEEAFDGYGILITSEIDTDDNELINVYNTVWDFKQGFKSANLSHTMGSAFIGFDKRIKFHFFSSFLAIVLINTLVNITGNKYSYSRIVSSLKRFNATLVSENVFKLSYYDEVLDDIAKATGLKLNLKYMTLGAIRSLIADTKRG